MHIVNADELLKTKNERKSLKKQEIQNILIKTCFQHDMAYGDFKDFPRRTAADRVLHDKAFNIAKIQSTMDIKKV